MGMGEDAMSVNHYTMVMLDDHDLAVVLAHLKNSMCPGDAYPTYRKIAMQTDASELLMARLKLDALRPTDWSQSRRDRGEIK